MIGSPWNNRNLNPSGVLGFCEITPRLTLMGRDLVGNLAAFRLGTPGMEIIHFPVEERVHMPLDLISINPACALS
jgi:hypothetical protein